MTTTKIITNIIYWLVLPAFIIFDFNNFSFYFIVACILIQAVFILSVYRVNNRNISGETILVEEHSPFTTKELFLFVLFVLLVFSVQLLIFLKSLPRVYQVIYVSVAIVSLIIQHLIESGKKTPVFIIENNNLYVNDFFVKTYNLEELAGIGYDGYTEIYIARFANNKRVHIKKTDFRQEDLDQFFAVMISKSNVDVEISESIRNEIVAAAKHLALPGQGLHLI